MATRIEHGRPDKGLFDRLIFQASRASSAERAWLYLEASHVVGQLRFWPHLRSHAHMLSLAWRLRDGREVIGQLFRLALVPLGHLSGRLPIGNPGRANVSAFEPMAVRPELKGLIDEARRTANSDA
jgi:hypothetical protein